MTSPINTSTGFAYTPLQHGDRNAAVFGAESPSVGLPKNEGLPTNGSINEDSFERSTNSSKNSTAGIYNSKGKLNAPETKKSNSSEKIMGQTEEKKAEKEEEKKVEEQEEKEVEKLKERDAEVKAHEQAHKNALGQYAAGGISYSYTTGPDGRRYAVGGEVPVDMSSEKTPEETIKKMQTIRRAAMAPKEPSSADRSVAAQAGQIAAQAQAEMMREKSKGENEDQLDPNKPFDSSLPISENNNDISNPNFSPVDLGQLINISA